MRKGMAAVLLLALCLLGGAASAQEEFYKKMPEALVARQTTRSETVSKTLTLKRTYPKTANAQVNAEMAALVDGMADAARAEVPKGAELIDVGAVITRSGTSFMSFLTIAETTGGRELLRAAYDARVYDMETGQRVALTDLLEPDGEGYALLGQAVREQLGAAFPDDAPD